MNKNTVRNLVSSTLLDDIQNNGWWYSNLEINKNIVYLVNFYRSGNVGKFNTESVYFPFVKNNILIKLKKNK